MVEVRWRWSEAEAERVVAGGGGGGGGPTDKVVDGRRSLVFRPREVSDRLKVPDQSVLPGPERGR